MILLILWSLDYGNVIRSICWIWGKTTGNRKFFQQNCIFRTDPAGFVQLFSAGCGWGRHPRWPAQTFKMALGSSGFFWALRSPKKRSVDNPSHCWFFMIFMNARRMVSIWFLHLTITAHFFVTVYGTPSNYFQISCRNLYEYSRVVGPVWLKPKLLPPGSCVWNLWGGFRKWATLNFVVLKPIEAMAFWILSGSRHLNVTCKMYISSSS